MAITIDIIREWLEEGKEKGATHVMIVCDTFDYEDYPVYVKPHEDIKKKAAEYTDVNMQNVMEIYNLSMDIEEQLAPKENRKRVFNY